MRFAPVVLAVIFSLQLPAPSTAFFSAVDTSGGGATTTATSSSSWWSNLFGDRSGTEEEETGAIGKRMQQSNLPDRAKQVKDPTPEEEQENKKKEADANPNFKHQPSKSQTGVDEHVARLAATLSSQLYEVASGAIDRLTLSTEKHEVEVVIEDFKGIFQTTNPPFAAVVSGTTMVIGWRGSSTATDWINDGAASPCSNLALGNHAKNVKLQGGMTSLCLNDIAVHQETIIDECKKRGITEIVTTG